MESRWSDEESARFTGPVGPRVYTSRLLGAEPSLVMHGGGNTSVKLREPDRLGVTRDVLYVKGSGWDLATIEAPGFAPTRLDHLLALADLEELSDTEMAEQLRLACLRGDAPAPSVEAILHAVLPAPYVDHTHADAVLAITNTPDGLAHVKDLYGDRVVVVDYVMPGFALARRCAEEFPARRTDGTIGMVLMHHGLFTFGETARESYERTIELVDAAERYLAAAGAWHLPTGSSRPASPGHRRDVASLRADISELAGRPMVLTTRDTPRVAAFLGRDDHADLARRGPLTPDHVIRTKRVPLVGRDVESYAADYERYFLRNATRHTTPLTMLDPAPRVVLDPELGLLAAGRTTRDADVAADIAERTLDAVERAAALDDWQALGEHDVFDVEYWELEQAKLRRGRSSPPLTGEVGLVTGAASGIGRATVDALGAAGAAVVGLDVDTRIAERADADVLGLRCDVTDERAVDEALDRAVARFGGIDLLVLNAGVFPPSTRIEELSLDDWRAVMSVNLDAGLLLLRLAADVLACSPRGGRVVVNASKNVPAPGPGAAAYSASKAALTQLGRVAALEWASRGIRVNIVHPNAVFDTGIWDDETLAARATSYGLSVEEYRRNNLLGVEVSSRDVAEVITALCLPAFAKTTGAQIPVDGGNERVV